MEGQLQHITPHPSLLATTGQSVSQYFCCICNLSFRSSTNLSFHMRKTHRLHDDADVDIDAAPKTPKAYHCPVKLCPYGEPDRHFSSLSLLKQHFVWKHQEKLFACQFCSRRYPTRMLLDAHLKECGRFFSCEDCARWYKDLKNLRSHYKKAGHGVNSVFKTAVKKKHLSHHRYKDKFSRPQLPQTSSQTTNGIRMSHSPTQLLTNEPQVMNESLMETAVSNAAQISLVIMFTGDQQKPVVQCQQGGRFRSLAPRVPTTVNSAVQTDYRNEQPYPSPVMVHQHTAFRSPSNTEFTVVSYPSHHTTMQTQTEYSSPSANGGLSVGIQYSYGSPTGIHSGVCVNSPSNMIGVGLQTAPDPLDQLLDMQTQTYQFLPGIEMHTQTTCDNVNWDDIFSSVNKRSTGV